MSCYTCCEELWYFLMRKPYAVGLCLSYPKNVQRIWCTDIRYEHEVLFTSHLSFSCQRTPVLYLFTLKATLSPSSPSFFHPLNSSHLKTFLVFCPTIFQNLPSWPGFMLPDTSQPQAQLLALRFLCPSPAFSAPCGDSCCQTKPHCCRHLLVPFSSVPFLSLQQQLCISF